MKSKIKDVLSDAINSLINNYQGSSLTDIFLIVDEECGELSVFDDEQNLLSKSIIEEWEQFDDEHPINYSKALREVVVEMDDNGYFNSLEVYTPFSINFSDEDFIVLDELLTIEDDSIIRIESDFMKRMDKEFDEFLDQLLNE
ncbi:hypothetical protein [Dysgonomonas sp. 216]|uniref:hypothetical protein n=1 Tax=Dysgonomonas sp. 216 TaxID=2302934 RepID=UPI001C88E114|nr:hypothetical protein [Dysgonomonas sp. 216]